MSSSGSESSSDSGSVSEGSEDERKDDAKQERKRRRPEDSRDESRKKKREKKKHKDKKAKAKKKKKDSGKKSKRSKKSKHDSDSSSDNDEAETTGPVKLSEWADGDADAPRSMVTGEIIKRERKLSKDDKRMEKERAKKLAKMNGQYEEMEVKNAKVLRREALEKHTEAKDLLENIQKLSSSAYRGFDPEREAVLQDAAAMKNYCEYFGLKDGRIVCFKKGIGRDTENLRGAFEGHSSSWAKRATEGFTAKGWAQLTQVGSGDGLQSSTKSILAPEKASTAGKTLKRSSNPHGQISLPERSLF